jgi:hypothetical protein
LPPGSARPESPDAVVDVPDLRVTEGAITRGDGTGILHVEAPALRAVLRTQTLPDVELRFVYLGPTETRARLGSGDARVQLGAKLRAADSCNVVYAMLRLEPETRVVVQVKHNPDAHTHEECKNGGYRTVRPEQTAAIPPIAMGSAHRFRAAMSGPRVDVWLDGVLVWQGDVGSEALAFDGPVGLRTDNGRFDVSVVAPRFTP